MIERAFPNLLIYSLNRRRVWVSICELVHGGDF
jgi:hypothetical protein